MSAAPTKAKPRPVTTSYENPLGPGIPGDGTVDSCADPMIIQGQDGETINGEQVWYMYCTTDPLNDEDVDENGDPIFHRIPMNVSTDLVNWTYVGDAFPLDGGDLPDWIDPTAAFWAPEVVYSSAPTSTTCSPPSPRRPPQAAARTRAVATAPSGWPWATAPWDPGSAADEPVIAAPAGPQRRAVLLLLDLRPGRPR